MKFAKKKAQSAMEYLMTYGWAILIVIIVAAALYALGVFNPAAYQGNIPTGFTALGTPSDWSLDSSGNFKIILSNNKLGASATIDSLTATMSGQATGTTYNTFNCTGNDAYLSLAPGQVFTVPDGCTDLTFQLSPVQASATAFSVGVSLSYNTGGFNHTDTGTVTGVVG